MLRTASDNASERAGIPRGAKRLRHPEELDGTDDPYPVPGIQHQKIVIAGYDNLGARGRGKLQILVVLRVATVVHLERRFDPHRSIGDQRQDGSPVFIGQRACKLLASEHAANLGLHLRRQSDNVLLPRLQNRLTRNTVALEGCPDDGACVDDDQCRRSAL